MSNGVLLMNKPIGFSSFQIVRILKNHYKKVGHAGTLDPFASGLLIILIGKATKKFTEILNYEKQYIGEIILGMVTDTYDISGKIIKKMNAEHNYRRQMGFTHCQIDELNRIADSFIGEIEQIPPRFSAIKKEGKKLYDLSRRGFNVQPKMRRVFIKSFNITECDYPKLKFDVVVGKGAYIRSLVYDFGNRLGGGATLMTLRRIRIGNYKVTDAKKLGDILLANNIDLNEDTDW